jgi:hypothetical protein
MGAVTQRQDPAVSEVVDKPDRRPQIVGVESANLRVTAQVCAGRRRSCPVRDAAPSHQDGSVSNSLRSGSSPTACRSGDPQVRALPVRQLHSILSPTIRAYESDIAYLEHELEWVCAEAIAGDELGAGATGPVAVR